MKYWAILIAFSCSTQTLRAQHFLNGSFEDNIANNCYYNILNSTFDSLVSFTKGIGNLNALDIFFDDSCTFFGPAEDGEYFVDLETT